MSTKHSIPNYHLLYIVCALRVAFIKFIYNNVTIFCIEHILMQRMHLYFLKLNSQYKLKRVCYDHVCW